MDGYEGIYRSKYLLNFTFWQYFQLSDRISVCLQSEISKYSYLKERKNISQRTSYSYGQSHRLLWLTHMSWPWMTNETPCLNQDLLLQPLVLGKVMRVLGALAFFPHDMNTRVIVSEHGIKPIKYTSPS